MIIIGELLVNADRLASIQSNCRDFIVTLNIQIIQSSCFKLVRSERSNFHELFEKNRYQI
jgi:hypothetical protein